MARFARIDSQIRANRLILATPFKVPELNPLFCESRFRALNIANHSFEAIRSNRSHVMKIGASLRIDSRESIHANRLDSRCESLGHLSFQLFPKSLVTIKYYSNTKMTTNSRYWPLIAINGH